jgi:sodium/potassium-transporting ATPase subunit alpha
VVRGDLLVLEEGDRIAADAVLIGDNSLYVNMATLTGESEPVKKTTGITPAHLPADPGQTIFAGTTVVSGNGVAVVFATGTDTEFGRIAGLTTAVHKRLTPMQLEIIRITRILTIAALIVGGIFFILGFLAGRGIFVAAIFALSLIVANVPEGMLPTITLSLSIASQNMAKRNALIKNLDSVQTLGSVTVICTDKTGTLTRNRMSAKVICLAGGEEVHITGEGHSSDREFEIRNPQPGSRERLEEFLRAGMLNCRANVGADDSTGDPTEIAIVAAARQAGIGAGGFEKGSEIPFTSDRKMMSTIARKEDKTFIFTKGAPEVILPLAATYLGGDGMPVPLDPATRDQVAQKAELMEREAFRVLAVAYGRGPDEKDLILLGLIGFLDLPRGEVADAVKTCYAAKIRVMVLTGDNPVTAGAVAKRIGLRVDRTITGDELRVIPDSELAGLLKNEDILFARMHPDQKLRIAQVLQENGEIVAMTGDGVNDAPALKRADIGIAMGERGTEVAKEAADMILVDDNFASIVAAVEEGRTIYFNIKKFVTYILSSNVPEIVPYILQFFLRIPLPLSVIQILSIDLGSDMLPGLALGCERPEKGIMERPPVGKNERILDREVFRRGYFFIGVIEAAAAMTAFLGFLFLNGWIYGDLSITDTHLHYQAMTMTLLGAIACQLANVWTLRSWELSALRPGLFSNRLLILAIIAECIWIWMLLNVEFVQVIFDTAYIPPQYLLLLVPFPVFLFCAHELYKYRIRKRARTGSA